MSDLNDKNIPGLKYELPHQSCTELKRDSNIGIFTLRVPNFTELVSINVIFFRLEFESDTYDN